MNFLKNYKLLIGTALGSIAGYAYYYFVGCANGTCPISSNPIISTLYGAMMGGIMFVPNNVSQSLIKNKRNKQMSLEVILKEKRGTIIDVRSPEEYRGGAVVGSINIPLQEIPHRVDELKQYAQPLVLCCASGGRSGQADQYLSQMGLDCINGGPWTTVNFYQSQQGLQ